MVKMAAGLSKRQRNESEGRTTGWWVQSRHTGSGAQDLHRGELGYWHLDVLYLIHRHGVYHRLRRTLRAVCGPKEVPDVGWLVRNHFQCQSGQMVLGLSG